MLRGLIDIGKGFVSINPSAGQVWNVMKYSACFFTGRFPLRPFYQPLSIGVYITYKCNLHCKFCWNKAVNKKEFSDNDITYDEFKTIIENPRTKHAFRVSYVGGEPLLHKDLFRFIDLAWKNKKLSMFPSNGLLIEKRLNEFKTSPLHTIQISLYDGYVERQIKNVELLRKANPNLEIILSRYVTTEKRTLQYMEEVVKMARAVGVKKVCFQNFVATRPEDEHLSIYDDNKDVLEYFAAFKKAHGLSLSLALPTPISRRVEDKLCFDLYTVVFTGRGGMIAPCSTIPPSLASFGNINTDGFWASDYFMAHRKAFISKFPFHPSCRYCYECSKHVRQFI